MCLFVSFLAIYDCMEYRDDTLLTWRYGTILHIMQYVPPYESPRSSTTGFGWRGATGEHIRTCSEISQGVKIPLLVLY